MSKYYLNKGQENLGPFDKEELKAQKINKETLVWTEEMVDWKKAGEIDELKSVLVSIPPPIKKNNKQKKPTKTNYLKYLLIAAGILIVIAIISNKAASGTSTATTKEDDTQNRQIRNQINELIPIKTNQYTVDGWGGITNLNIIVKNNTDYTIDKITVAIDYIKKNGDTYKTEKLTFENIPPHQDKSLAAPDSNRGLSVNIKKQTITSTQLKLCYDASNILQVGNPDPYKCNP